MSTKPESDKLREALNVSPLISHDLRSALSDVIGGLELIDKEELSGDNQSHLGRAIASAKSLSQMLNALTEDFTGPRDHLITPKDPFAVRSFLKDLEQRWSARAAEKGLAFHVDIDDRLPKYLQIDRMLLDRILSNLLENSIKFCDTGYVNLSLGVEDDWFTVWVRDTGPGFSKAAMERLFEYQGRPKTSGLPGTGLGLHIVKRLVDQMSGEASVFNSAKGGVVVLRFPKNAWFTEQVQTIQTGGDFSLDGMRILLAEDNQTSQLVLRRMIEKLGARLHIANDGIEALKAFEREDFDLVLLDVEMPRRSGLDVIRSIRARHDAKSETPLIAVTAFVMPEHEQQILDAGANGTIRKPVTDAKVLALQVSNILTDKDNTTEEEISDAPSVLLDETVYDALAEAVGTTKISELLAKVLDDLLSVQYRLSDALQTVNFEEIRRQTHVLISVAGAVGAKRLQNNAQTLNLRANKSDGENIFQLSDPCLVELRHLIAEIKLRQRQNKALPK